MSLRCSKSAAPEGHSTASATTPGVGIAGVGEVGCVRCRVPPVRDRAVVADVGVEERPEPVLLGVGPVPALPAVDAPRVHELGAERRVGVVLLADQVHVHGVTGRGRLGYGKHCADAECQGQKDAGDPLVYGHRSPLIVERWEFQPTNLKIS